MTANLVVRNPNVPALPQHGDYREYLRVDFWFACAYCTITEQEARGITFEIDHYHPTSKGGPPTQYKNLMWSCDRCNGHKREEWPAAAVAAAGYRFFRPDEDDAEEHFQLKGDVLEEKTKVGEYTKEVLFLNRLGLKRLRQVRRRLKHPRLLGLRGLRDVPLDRLPPKIRGQVRARQQALAATVEEVQKLIEATLRTMARSELIDADPDAKTRTRARREYLEKLGAAVAGDDDDDTVQDDENEDDVDEAQP